MTKNDADTDMQRQVVVSAIRSTPPAGIPKLLSKIKAEGLWDLIPEKMRKGFDKAGQKDGDGDTIVWQGPIFDAVGARPTDHEKKIPKDAEDMFAVGSPEVQAMLRQLWIGILKQTADMSDGVFAQEIPDPKSKVLSMLQTAYVEFLHGGVPEEGRLLREAFDAVKAMGFVGAISIAPSITHDNHGNSVGYHKLIHTGLAVEGAEGPVDLSRIDPPSIMKAKSHGQIAQAFQEAFAMAMPSMEAASQKWADEQNGNKLLEGSDEKTEG
jgi:hypothetical protein